MKALVAADQTYRDATLTGAEQRYQSISQLVLGDHDDNNGQRMHIFSWLLISQLPNAQHV